MPVETSNNLQPKEGSLVVCAGTITTKKAQDMGKGFKLFQDLFKGGLSCNTPGKTWEEELQVHLNKYFKNNTEMPPYVRVAQKDTFIGGVATVPKKGVKGLSDNKKKPTEEEEKSQYKLAVINAINDAKELKRPLFLQPLGIGGYGWDAKEAADLFAEAILIGDPNNEVEIIVPIYSQKEKSADQVFKEALNNTLSKTPGRIPSLDKSKKAEEPEPPKQKEDALPPLSSHLGVTEDEKDDKDILIAIVKQLISNIETAAKPRVTYWNSASKVNTLKGIQKSIEDKSPTAGSDEYQEFVQEIMEACKIKRNPIQFWKQPDSVGEYKKLLAEHNIEYTPKTKLKH
jgi:hypothetical protein